MSVFEDLPHFWMQTTVPDFIAEIVRCDHVSVLVVIVHEHEMALKQIGE